MATLTDFLTDVRNLLHDPQDAYWSQTQKTLWINKALQRRDRDTGANRVQINLALTAGVDTYTFTTLGNTSVFDVVGINLIFTNLRIVLGQMSFTELNTYVRQYQPAYQFYPVKWCRYGPATVILAPAPAQAYVTEWDCCVFSAALVNLTDADVLPYPFTEPVPYYAAHLAKLNERQWDEAADFKQQYDAQIQTVLGDVTGLVPSMYPSGSGMR